MTASPFPSESARASAGLPPPNKGGLLEKPPEPEELAEIGFRAIERGAPRGWGAAAAICAVFLALGTAATTRLLLEGLGLWGLNQPVMWGWAIVNFVWWIGIGHAGTFISAILRLMRQPWRTSIHRTAETSTTPTPSGRNSAPR